MPARPAPRVRPALSSHQRLFADLRHAALTVAPIRLDGTSVKFIAGALPTVISTAPRDTETLLRGLDAKIESPEPVVPVVKKDANGISYSEIAVPETFPPGSVLVFATWMEDLKADLDDLCAEGAEEAFKELDLVDLNSAIYRADGEERDAGALAVEGSVALDVGLIWCLLQSAAMASTRCPVWRPSFTAVCKDGWHLSRTL